MPTILLSRPQAYRLAKEQMSKAQAAARQGDSDGDEPIERPRELRSSATGSQQLASCHSADVQSATTVRPEPTAALPHAASRGWRTAIEQDEGEASEDGELPAEGGDGGSSAAQRSAGQRGGARGPARTAVGDGDGEDGGRKRKHAPIVWHTPPKAARQGGGGGSGMAHVGSSKGLNSLGGGGSGARTAADRAMEELAAFQQQQAAVSGSGNEGNGGLPAMKPSPSVSSEEDDGMGAPALWGLEWLGSLLLVWCGG